jgi:hypothetical protein
MGLQKRNEDMEVEYNMVPPDPYLYKDVHSGMDLAQLPMKIITCYFEQHKKKFEDKYKQLYEQR